MATESKNVGRRGSGVIVSLFQNAIRFDLPATRTSHDAIQRAIVLS